ncbi:MAG: NUDIX domain-containing protein [Gemmatimonadales bacterium]|jgi:8-oxo-dGTP pyrophosphatase MutT (NUDIX family)
MSRRYRMETEELLAAEAMGAERVPPKPRAAAGVILARDSEGGPEVLLVRRRVDVGFAAGAYVFPGGTLDAADADAAWEDWYNEPPADAVEGAADPDGPSARSFVVAALRELFEETGVMLASGALPGHDALARERQALVAGRKLFLDIVSGLGLRLAGDRLLLCARWVTPESLSRRYDARFFLAAAPPDTRVSAELGELVEHVWMTPAKALERYFDYDFRMLFPTARTLSWLEEGTSVAEWRARFRGVAVQAILPRLRRVDGEVIPVMPGEPRYDEREGDG